MYYLGIDIGSTTMKLALRGEDNKLVFSDYQRHNANIRQAAKEVFRKMYGAMGNIELKVVLTGSVGMGYAERLGIKFVQEVVASAAYISAEYPDVHTLVDMGGEDSKMVFFEEGKVPDMRMNGVCAGGTGAFIDQMASLLNIENDEINTLADESTQIYPIASRCGVFSKTDIQNLIANGVGKSDIVVSTFKALALQVISSLARGVDMKPPVLFCGGPFAFMPELKKQFCEVMGIGDGDIVQPERAELIPALGCSQLAKEEEAVELRKLIWFLRYGKEERRGRVADGLLPLFRDKDDFAQWEKGQRSYVLPRGDVKVGGSYYLGVDSGSTTTKLVLLDAEGRMVYSDYRRNGGDSFAAFHGAMQQMYDECGDVCIANSCVTGYGESLLKTAFSLNNGVVETIAHSVAARRVMPNVSFVLDIGGQDMKAIFMKDGEVRRIEINESCSSGCGSFLETFANSFNYPISDFAELACYASQPYDLGTRCTVFMNSKVKQAMREGATVEDIAAGFSYSVIKNCLYKVLKIKDIKKLGEAIVVQGGTFKNKSVVRALELLTGSEIRYTDVPELMGAYGAALYGMGKAESTSKAESLGHILTLQEYKAHTEHCAGCENQCLVKAFEFSNGRVFYSGNNCEKIYSNVQEQRTIGVNMLAEKYRLLFDPRSPLYASYPKTRGVRVGIPRALGMFENYPFWKTLFEKLGFEVVLSAPSTNKLVEKGSASIMADSICFPAKVMHGHVYNLAEKKVDRMFYPYVVYEKKDDKESNNSYNCPIVAGYSDVLKSAINPQDRFGVPLDAPIISFNDNELLMNSCVEYFATLGVSKKDVKNGVKEALKIQEDYLHRLEVRANEVLAQAIEDKRMVIVLAGKPYHSDPLIEHKISGVISRMGVDVITENVAINSGKEVFGSINAVTQWSYTNRVFKAAHLVAQTPKNVHFVEFNSFGCGPDAFILDEVSTILERGGKFPTTLKIDDVNNVGSLYLRIRSLVENYRIENKLSPDRENECKAFENTPRFDVGDAKRKIIAPYFADGYTEFLPAILSLVGYDLEILPIPNKADEEEGLRYANNDICFPATVVIGSLLRALKSGKYELDNTAVIITQTGGQCRASNYISLLKNALLASSIKNVPVISLALGRGMENTQPGFKIPWLKLAPIITRTMIYADCLAKLFYATVSRSGGQIDECKKMKQEYVNRAIEAIKAKNSSGLVALIGEAARDFNTLIVSNVEKPKIGIVGEIFVKYNDYSSKNIIEWMLRENVEVVPTSFYNFFTTSIVNAHENRSCNIKKESMPLWVTNQVYKLIQYVVAKFERELKDFPYYEPFSDIFKDMENAKRIVSPGANFGEGWLIPAEVSNMAERGVKNIVSVQPFGCIANHIVSKGVEKRIKQIYPQLSMLFLDFDASTSDANIYNRLHFMVNNARKMSSNL